MSSGHTAKARPDRPAADPPTPPGGITRDVWLAATAVIAGLAMALLDTTIVNVALKSIGSDLDASVGAVQWVSTSYLLALAVVIPMAGWASERFGPRRVWTVALVLFVAGSVLCGAAWSMGALIAFRVLQGVGGGLINPVGMGIIARTAGPDRMGRVMAVLGIPMLLMPVLGPVLGGLITDTTTWRWIFYINLPLGILALGLAARLLPSDDAARTARRLDALGVPLLAAGLALIVFGLSEVQSSGGLAAPAAYGPLLGGLALVVAFVVHAGRAEQPLLNIRLFRRPSFSAAAVGMFFTGAALYGALFLLPLYYQLSRGESPLSAGLLLLPQSLGAALAMPLAGRFTDRVGGGPVAAVGLALCAVATVPLAVVGAHTSYVWLSAVLAVRGVGVGAALMPITAAAYAPLNRADIPNATSIISVLQQLGGSVGVAVLAVSLQTGLDGAHRPTAVADAFAGSFQWAFALTVVAVVAAAFLAAAARRGRAGGG
ncbi:DHA2 family efflux MFS transporter permease subunit [Actinomadura chibensis]|uniref:DHA2 family efflux MFS transporter permease subunit n=1 Tax=Actinomadura chibensis TaxID=392828 RepID=A0A5D0NTL7_9ACTN|nr:DHA2 family efflux MFS transporter permease subunit [Actinomadura chibensis]TYB47983.1 DHA2 family efflux MFS transporter permease subunit [Actinomadura chibensis]